MTRRSVGEPTGDSQSRAITRGDVLASLLFSVARDRRQRHRLIRARFRQSHLARKLHERDTASLSTLWLCLESSIVRKWSRRRSIDGVGEGKVERQLAGNSASMVHEIRLPIQTGHSRSLVLGGDHIGRPHAERHRYQPYRCSCGARRRRHLLRCFTRSMPESRQRSRVAAREACALVYCRKRARPQAMALPSITS